MNISRKLILSFSLASGLIALSSYIGHHLQLNSETEVDLVMQEVTPIIYSLQNTRHFSQSITSNLSEMLMHANMDRAEPAETHAEQFQQAKEQLQENISKLDDLISYNDTTLQEFPLEADSINEIRTQSQSLKELALEVMSLRTEQASNSEVMTLLDKIIGVNNRMIAAIDKALDREMNELGESHVTMDDLLEISFQKSIIVTAISFLTIILLWIFVTKKISTPLSKLHCATIDVSKGKLEKKVDIITRDEIGDLAQAFNEMIDRLGETTISKDYVENILGSMTEALFVIDTNGKITRTNRSTLSLLNFQNDELDNVFIGEIIPELNMGDGLLENLGGFVCINEKESHLRSKSGKSLTVYLTCSPLNDSDGNIQGLILLAHDISARKEAEERLHYLANYDPLTGLSNRAMLFERLANAISQPSSGRKNIGLLLCGLDRFKLINDTLGHEVGDQLLKKTAQQLQATVHNNNTVARIGGDEFAIVIPDISNTNEIITLAEKIIDSLSGPLLLNEHEVFVTLSTGISLYPLDGINPLTLLKHADIALCDAKSKGKNQISFYADVSGTKSTSHLKLESDLQHALERDEIRVFYQPQIDIKQRKIVGCEALIRWQHGERGLVSPAEFLPLAEETGLMTALGEKVFNTACADTKQWINLGYTDFKTAINLSDQEFKRDDLLELIQNALNENQLRPANLELEITENIVMQNPKSAESIMQKIRAMGIELSIDDFGTGYSSLSHLKRFPINTVKIDRSFIMDIVVDNDDLAIVEAIVAIAKRMNLNVIAEGVENSAQQDLLRINGCHNVQGFLYSPAIPADEFTTLLANQAALFSQLEQAS